MQHDSLSKAEPQKSLPHHVHPLVAWTAIFNFALIFSLAPTMILAQTTTSAMSEGSEAVAMRLPESSKLAYARHIAMEQEGVTPSDSQHGSMEADRKGDHNKGGKDMGMTKKMGDGDTASSCVRSCRITKSDCTRTAESNGPALHVCYEKFAKCMDACGVSLVAGSKGAKFLMSTGLKDAEQAYKDAAAAARKKRSDAFKKAQADFEADMKAAQDAFKAAKDAAKAAAKETSASTDTTGTTTATTTTDSGSSN